MLEVGKKVIIRSKEWFLDNKDHSYGGAVVCKNNPRYLMIGSMTRFCGKEATITRFSTTDPNKCYLDIDNGEYYWVEEFFENNLELISESKMDLNLSEFKSVNEIPKEILETLTEENIRELAKIEYSKLYSKYIPKVELEVSEKATPIQGMFYKIKGASKNYFIPKNLFNEILNVVSKTITDSVSENCYVEKHTDTYGNVIVEHKDFSHYGDVANLFSSIISANFPFYDYSEMPKLLVEGMVNTKNTEYEEQEKAIANLIVQIKSKIKQSQKDEGQKDYIRHLYKYNLEKYGKETADQILDSFFGEELLSVIEEIKKEIEDANMPANTTPVR